MSAGNTVSLVYMKERYAERIINVWIALFFLLFCFGGGAASFLNNSYISLFLII